MISFVLGTTELNEQQKKVIKGLKKAVEKGDTRERTGATMTLLKLCESASNASRLQT